MQQTSVAQPGPRYGQSSPLPPAFSDICDICDMVAVSITPSHTRCASRATPAPKAPHCRLL